jgi:hypothetical protein
MMLLTLAIVVVLVVEAAMRLRDGDDLDRFGRCVASAAACVDR